MAHPAKLNAEKHAHLSRAAQPLLIKSGSSIGGRLVRRNSAIRPSCWKVVRYSVMKAGPVPWAGLAISINSKRALTAFLPRQASLPSCDVWRVTRDIRTCDIPRLSGSIVGDQEDRWSYYISGIPLISRLAIYLLITRLYIYILLRALIYKSLP